MAESPATPLFRKLLVAATIAAAAAVSAFVYGHSLDRDMEQCQDWIDAMQIARFMVPTEGPYPERDALEGALHPLEVALPEIEAAEVTRLRTVRNCTEAAFKVVNTSMVDSPRHHQRGEAFSEFAAALDTLFPEVEQAVRDLATKRVLVTRVMGLLGLITVGLAVACGVVGIRARRAADQR